VETKFGLHRKQNKKAVENCHQSRKKSSKKPPQKIVNKAIKSRKNFSSKKLPQKVVNKKVVKFFFKKACVGTEHRKI
jgi:hypothetical protein